MARLQVPAWSLYPAQMEGARLGDKEEHHELVPMGRFGTAP